MSAPPVAAPRPVLADALPGALARDVAVVVAGALLVAGAAQIVIPLPFTPVPITGQTFGVLLVGAALGPARGLSSLLLYLVLGLGLPFYAEAEAGVSVLVGATGGYLLAFPIAAALVGAIARAGHDRTAVGTIGAFVLADLVILIPGTAWLGVVQGLDLATAMEMGFTPFVVGDLLKALLAALLLPGAWSVLRRVDREPGAAHGDDREPGAARGDGGEPGATHGDGGEG